MSLSAGGLVGCGGGAPAVTSNAPTAEARAAQANVTQGVFEKVVPSVVAVFNDDEALREEEAKKAMGGLAEEHAKVPKTVIDVSLRKEPLPDGTGYAVDGGLIVTAAHVIRAPDRLKIKTRAGQMVDVELVRIDEVRDVAILKPKTELKDVPPLKIGDPNIKIGSRVWALGHTAGNGALWSLSWGISEGVASGLSEMMGAQLLLFDAPVFPGFSGGPVVTLDTSGTPVAVGVNHAILFTGGSIIPVASISSATSARDIRDTLDNKPAALQTKFSEYAKQRGNEKRAELFVTSALSVHKVPGAMSTAAIMGNLRTIEASKGSEPTKIPLVTMLFNMPKGEQELEFELDDPQDHPVAKFSRRVKASDKERVTFASANFSFEAKLGGRYDILVRHGGKVIGRTDVWVEDGDDDEQTVDEEDDDLDGDPRVDIVVASGGREDPLALSGIRSSWAEYRYPHRVSFTWFARGTRGWSGKNVSIGAFVLNDKGEIVGRGLGCVRGELKPEHPWSCMGSGGAPLLRSTGRYDVVFALNDRPVAIWPMEAVVRQDQKSGSPLEKWIRELKKKNGKK